MFCIGFESVLGFRHRAHRFDGDARAVARDRDCGGTSEELRPASEMCLPEDRCKAREPRTFGRVSIVSIIGADGG